MRVLLLNDTRSENHVGCRLVVRNIFRQCKRVGLDVVRTVPHSTRDVEQFVRDHAYEYDLLLINGEGTMHHDRPKAMALARSAMRASRLGKFVVLLNTVWQDNRRINRYLSHVDLIFCRESFSKRELAAAGYNSKVVPDMVFATDFTSGVFPHSRSGTVVLDSVRREETLQWAWHALYRKYAFMPMHEANFARLKRRPWLTLGLRICSGCSLKKPGGDFLRDLGKFESVVSGRFHGVCLAFLLEIPVVGVRSNTHKIESIFRDAGLDERAIVASSDAHELSQKLEYVRENMPSIRSYVAAAPERIGGMFHEIRARALQKAATRPLGKVRGGFDHR